MLIDFENVFRRTVDVDRPSPERTPATLAPTTDPGQDETARRYRRYFGAGDQDCPLDTTVPR